MATTSLDVLTLTIIELIFGDVNAIMPNYVSLVNAHRLLVGSAEEIHRIPGVTPDVVARAIERFDRSGVLIDILTDLLCCKISFLGEFLAVTCAPIDLFRLLANRLDVADTPHLVAEEVIVLEVVRRAQELLRGPGAVPPCTPPGGPPYTFGTSFFVPPPPPPPPIPPEPPFAPPCFSPVPAPVPAVPAPPSLTEAAVAAVADDDNGPPAEGDELYAAADKHRLSRTPRRDCNPLRPRRLKK